MNPALREMGLLIIETPIPGMMKTLIRLLLHITNIPFHLNVWCGLLGDNLIGPFFLPPRLSGVSYLQFLQDNIPELLQDIPIANRQGMWFMHEDAQAHYSHIVTD